MIEPKFRELVIRLKCSRWVLRFWFGTDSCIPAKELGQYLLVLRTKIDDAGEQATLVQIDRMVNDYFTPGMKLAACEILTAANHAGVVLYYDWP